MELVFKCVALYIDDFDSLINLSMIDTSTLQVFNDKEILFGLSNKFGLDHCVSFQVFLENYAKVHPCMRSFRYLTADEVIILACKFLDTKIMEECLKRGISNLEVVSKKVIKSASKLNYVHEAVKLIFENDLEVDAYYVINAYYYGSQVLVDFFTPHVDYDELTDVGEELLDAACHGGMIEYVKDKVENWDMEPKDFHNLLIYAARGRQLEIIDYLISVGGSFDESDITCIDFLDIIKSGHRGLITVAHNKSLSDGKRYINAYTEKIRIL